MQFFSSVCIVILVSHASCVSSLDFSDAVVGYSLEGRLFLQFHSCHISRHFEYLSFVLSQTEKNFFLRYYIFSLHGSLLETILVLDENIGHVDRVFELCLFFIRLFLIFGIKRCAHRRKAVAVDLVLSDLPDICFFLNDGKGTYPVCSLGGLVIVLRGILCLTEMNWRKGFVDASSKLREI